MISIAQAFRVWKRLLAQRDYPFPREARWVWFFFAAVGFAPIIAIFTWAAVDSASGVTFTWPPEGDFSFAVTAFDVIVWIIALAWIAAVAYVLAVIRFWSDRGIDRWINEGRLCRTCGVEGQRARVDRYDVTMRFRDDRKEYDRVERARRRGQRGHVTETA